MVKYEELTSDVERLLWEINANLERIADILEELVSQE